MAFNKNRNTTPASVSLWLYDNNPHQSVSEKQWVFITLFKVNHCLLRTIINPSTLTKC